MELPTPLVLLCKNEEVITIEALSETSYEKCYFPEYTPGDLLKNPRKVKVVEGVDVFEIFEDAIATKGYIPIPQN